MSENLISIVTPSLNSARFIKEAVESVLRQGYPEFEHIIVDGGSRDGTLRILREYSHLNLICEPDEGMYSALNKGIAAARGHIIAWLNADDIFTEGAFREVTQTFKRSPDAKAVSGGVAYFRGDSKDPQIYLRIPPVMEGDFWPRMVDTPATNGWFFRPGVFKQCGYFNPDYRFVADRDYFIRIALADIHPSVCDKTLYCYRQHDDSYTISAQDSRQVDRGMQRIKVLTEDLAMLERFLQQAVEPAVAQKAIRRSHSMRAYRLVATALFHRMFRQSFTAASRGWQYDLFWPLVFLRMSFNRLIKGHRD